MSSGEWAPEMELILAVTYFCNDPGGSRERLAHAVAGYGEHVTPDPQDHPYLDRLHLAAANCLKAAPIDRKLAVAAVDEVLKLATAEYRQRCDDRRPRRQARDPSSGDLLEARGGGA